MFAIRTKYALYNSRRKDTKNNRNMQIKFAYCMTLSCKIKKQTKLLCLVCLFFAFFYCSPSFCCSHNCTRLNLRGVKYNLPAGTLGTHECQYTFNRHSLTFAVTQHELTPSSQYSDIIAMSCILQTNNHLSSSVIISVRYIYHHLA